MKNYKKALLGVMIVSAMSLMAAEDRTIYVTTFADENGENPDKCSLREALVAAKQNKAFGGCSVGNTNYIAVDYIRLQAGEYKLNAELRPQSNVRIMGATPLDYSKKDPITHRYPALIPHQTIINGQGLHRIVNTLDSQANVMFDDLTLKNGYSDGLGGALLVAGPLTLTNTAILDSQAARGGALYIAAHNQEQPITVVNSLIQGNSASVGSVLAMDCTANLADTQANITIQQSSVIQNGNSNSLSSFDFCGKPRLTLTNTTVAKNKANLTQGHIFNLANGPEHRLSTQSVFSLNNNTIVENEAASTFYYDDSGIKVLRFNVLAFNTGKSCRYALNNGNLTERQPNISSSRNALIFPNAQSVEQGVCDLPETLASTEENSMSSVNLSGKQLSDVLYPMQPASAYNLFLPLYYPKNLDNDADLVNVEGFGCEVSDQRGLQRVTDGTLILDPEQKNSCEIGSVELMRMTAADIVNLKNVSHVTLFDSYQQEIDRLKALVQAPEKNKELLAQHQADLQNYENLLKFSKEKQKYRTIYIDPFALALKHDEPNADGSVAQLLELKPEHFNISTEVYGIGGGLEDAAFDRSKLLHDPNLKCEWDADVKRILFYRVDDQVTQNIDSAYCAYTITSVIDPTVQSSGLLEAKFMNIKPIAKADRYTIEYGSDLKINVNPLENDSDDGDGPVNTLLSGENKPAFYTDSNGLELPIRLTNVPSSVLVTADRSGPCPGDYVRETCYGGNLQIQVRNSYSPFDYELKYTVFDAEQELSNEATISLINTAKNSNTEGSGGGSLGLAGLFGLLGMAVYRVRRQFKS